MGLYEVSVKLTCTIAPHRTGDSIFIENERAESRPSACSDAAPGDQPQRVFVGLDTGSCSPACGKKNPFSPESVYDRRAVAGRSPLQRQLSDSVCGHLTTALHAGAPISPARPSGQTPLSRRALHPRMLLKRRDSFGSGRKLSTNTLDNVLRTLARIIARQLLCLSP